ncbi:MAG: carboxymuconolactone decarboxylase family protein [Actinobacteria bacterium]|nr:carboxymuconolactone decarboxylase family protein [Actinomycetota bacterium]
MLVRARVAGLNMCMWCVDGQRWFVSHETPEQLPLLDAVEGYRESPLFDDRQRAALDYATELTESKQVNPATFARLSRDYSEREICEIAWLISSEHLYNLNNLALGIGSDGLCEVPVS